MTTVTLRADTRDAVVDALIWRPEWAMIAFFLPDHDLLQHL
jgi:hypothetical protein